MDATTFEAAWNSVLVDGMYVLKHDTSIGKDVEQLIDGGSPIIQTDQGVRFLESVVFQNVGKRMYPIHLLSDYPGYSKPIATIFSQD